MQMIKNAKCRSSGCPSSTVRLYFWGSGMELTSEGGNQLEETLNVHQGSKH